MKILTQIFLAITFIVSSRAQNIHFISHNNCAKCKEISLIEYKKMLGDSVIEFGILIGNNRLQTSVAIENCNYVFGIGRQDTRVPRMSFSCHTNQPGKTFNGMCNAQKVGIWFKKYPWGGLKKAIMYDAGQVVEVITFRFNGSIKNVLNYRNGKKSNWGNYFYDKQGLVTNGMAPW